jgi:hypothetical protein
MAEGATIPPVEMPKVGPATQDAFDRLAEDFVARGAKKGSMFGMPVLKAGDKVFCGTFGDAMTFKLGPEDLAKANSTKGVEPFEPMKGRAMKEWVVVPVSKKAKWRGLAEKAWSYVKGGCPDARRSPARFANHVRLPRPMEVDRPTVRSVGIHDPQPDRRARPAIAGEDDPSAVGRPGRIPLIGVLLALGEVGPSRAVGADQADVALARERDHRTVR